MTKLFKKVLIFSLFVFACFMLVGCEESATDYDHTIVFYSTQGDSLQQVTQNAINAFEAKYPGWTIKHTQVGGYDDVRDKIVSDLSGGLQPDLAYCYADHVAQYMQTNRVYDMAELIKMGKATVKVGADYSEEKEVTIGYSAEEIADFVPGYYNEGYAVNFADYDKYGFTAESMLTLPFVKSTELLYYNADALEALGLEVATTWDELWEQAALIRAKYPTAIPLGYDSEANWFITMCEQNGWGYTSAQEPHFLFNNDDTKAWLEQLADYYDKGYFTTQEDYGSYTSGLFVKGVEGGAIYCIGSSGGASHQATDNFAWGVARIPASTTTKEGVNGKAVISQGPSLVMFKNDRCSNPDEKKLMTFLFVKELLDPTFQAAFSIKAGYNPCRISTYEVPAYEEHLADDTKITSVACQIARTMTEDFYTSPAFIGSSEARTQVGNALVYAMTGQKEPAKALADAYKNAGGK